MKLKATTKKPAALVQKQADLGVLGRFFGSKEHAPFYIAGILALLLLILLVVVAYFPVAALTPAMICPLFTLVVGYLFGKSPR